MESKKMHRKNYVVGSPAGEMSVFADDFSIMPNGTAVFTQLRELTGFHENGTLEHYKDMVPVLVLACGSFTSIRAVNKAGHDLYKETGEVQIVQ